MLPLLWKEPLQKHVIMAAVPASQALAPLKLNGRLDKMMNLKARSKPSLVHSCFPFVMRLSNCCVELLFTMDE